MQYYQFHIGDYTTATVHLTDSEDLAYRRLLDYYYMKEEPIPIDIPWVSRRLRLGSQDVENVLKEFFTLTDNGWENDRCNADISAFHAHIEKQRKNGKKGGRPRKNPKKTHGKPTANPPKSDGVPTVKPPSTHNPVPITQIENIYKKYPRKKSKGAALKAIEKALKVVDYDVLLEAVSEFARCNDGRPDVNFIPYPATWFNQRCWEDDRAEWSRWKSDNQEQLPFDNPTPMGMRSGPPDAYMVANNE